MKRIIFFVLGVLYSVTILVMSPWIFVPKLGKLTPGQTAGGWSHLWFWSTLFAVFIPWIVDWIIKKFSASNLQKEGLK